AERRMVCAVVRVGTQRDSFTVDAPFFREAVELFGKTHGCLLGCLSRSLEARVEAVIDGNGLAVGASVQSQWSQVTNLGALAQLAGPGAIGQLPGLMREFDDAATRVPFSVQNNLLVEVLQREIERAHTPIAVLPVELVEFGEGILGIDPAVSDPQRPGDTVVAPRGRSLNFEFTAQVGE